MPQEYEKYNSLTKNDFVGCVIVVAHPDDEVLWASSILRAAKKVIVCYQETDQSQKVSAGRIELLRNFPLDNVVCLKIKESNTYQTTSWRKPTESEYGIYCSRNSRAYIANFHLLVDLLKDHIDADDIVVTHNPWGEYGHEEHVQVYRAVTRLQKDRHFRLFVTGYVGDRVIHFMEQNTDRLGQASSLFAIDKSLCHALKRHYQLHDSWTWDDNYEWPDFECFYEVLRPDAALRPPSGTLSSMPVNVIWLDGPLPLWRRLFRKIKRRILAIPEVISRVASGKLNDAALGICLPLLIL